jgi:adenylosuccinate synthase
VLHQIPSGIFRSDIRNIIGNGVVLDPVIFKKEVDALARYNLDLRKNLYISKKAALIVPSHRLLDAAYEKSKGEQKIGSTLKGIGPAYSDKVARQGLRVGDILSPNFRDKYNSLLAKHETILNFYQYEHDLKAAQEEFFACVEFMKQFTLVESEYQINEELQAGHTILAEGAQGSLLDIDFGSYPYVTSSTTMAAGACTGLGIAPAHIAEVYGIFKAYCTRVGGGPFPTEQSNDTGEILRKEGNEYGSTTGRPRRCGWLDLPALKYAVMINGVTQLVMMKVDVLNTFDEIKVCTHYRLADGTLTEQIPHDMLDETIEPVYKTFRGWNTDLKEVHTFEQLPEALAAYISFLESSLGLAINFLSTGPDRVATLQREAVLG